MLQGLMFLPDGRVLIMDSELYKQTIDKSIVLDLFDGTALSTQSLQSSLEEEKTSCSTTRPSGIGHSTKDNSKKSIT